jgi:hypothetical protein
LLDFFSDESAELAVRLFFIVTVADSTPREQVWAVTDVRAVVVIPANKLKVAVFRLHLMVSRTALRTCFS